MTKVLFITANPNSAEGSFGMAVGEAFIEAYKNEHPQDEVVTIDLFNTTVPAIDADVFGAWGKFAAGEGFETLTEVQQQKVAAMNTNLETFMHADRY
ncbi:TPA: NAD(P)H-dependent oxidoreductase, partial [Bacillus cereus]|nr:NAD(P)H-dependent oxidoreductase [Bacillus cereus]